VPRELQGSENRYNATLTILEPGDRKEEGEALVAMLFEFTREYKMQIDRARSEEVGKAARAAQQGEPTWRNIQIKALVWSRCKCRF
jgi:hypothetical protein